MTSLFVHYLDEILLFVLTRELVEKYVNLEVFASHLYLLVFDVRSDKIVRETLSVD